MKLRAIPPVPRGVARRDEFDTAVKENLEVITGRRGEKIATLDSSTATLADVVSKLNEILARMQG